MRAIVLSSILLVYAGHFQAIADCSTEGCSSEVDRFDFLQLKTDVEGKQTSKSSADGHRVKGLESQNKRTGGFERRGSPEDLSKDPLFMLTWAPTAENRMAVAAHVGSEDKCKSWEGAPDCYIEAPEHKLVRKWIPDNATVMEFGGRFGTTTCEITKKLKNSGKLVTVEPDFMVWDFLENNIKKHSCYSRILRGAISSKPLRMLGSGYGGRSQKIEKNLSAGEVTVATFSFDEVEKSLGLKFDTLLIDCEGCAQDMMDQIGPKIQQQINLILIEADMPDKGGDCTSHCMNYPKFFKYLTDAGFKEVETFNDCDHAKTGAPAETWCGPWIKHYVFKRV